MQDTFKNCLRAVKINRKYRVRGISILLILSLVVSGSVFWMLRQTGLTLAGSAACGYEEHTHRESCYSKALVCGLTEESHVHSADCYESRVTRSDIVTVLTCSITDEPHAHTDSCYESRLEDVYSDVLICGLSDVSHLHTENCYAYILTCPITEHVHTVDCYTDEVADTETYLDWQNMFAGYVTGMHRDDLVSVARSQLGYTESVENFEVDSYGVRRGYTRYGAWYGMPYNDWSAMFVSFCLHYSGQDPVDAPYNTGANSMAQLWDERGRYAAANEYEPEYGDLIFFSDNTVGIISSVSFDMLTVIQGDIDNTVSERTVMSYDSSITGYGILTLPEYLTSVNQVSAVASSEQLVLAACDCGNDGVDAMHHVATCAYTTQLIMIASDYTVEELYAIWPQLPADAQNYILQHLEENAWQYGSKAEDLKELIDEDSNSTGIESICGNVVFKVAGALPKTASLAVSNTAYSETKKLSYINPNNRSSIRWSDVYDISIYDNGMMYTLNSPVTVTVRFPELQFNAEHEFFAVAHLDEVSGRVISSEYVDVTDNEITFTANGFSPYMFYIIDKEAEGGERILGTNWMSVDDSYFNYWEQFIYNGTEMMQFRSEMLTSVATAPSSTQIDEYGGVTDSGYGDNVVVSKTINGTDIENVFDITLTVQTQDKISEIYEEPDMAVVIVMDISNTMKDDFGDTTRYKAAIAAAENFIDNFASQSGDVSRIGYVAFNTDAHEIFGLSNCSSTEKATVLKNAIRQKTGEIINADGYASSSSRFTNIEAGLKMGADMLASAQNEHKYIIFLSDGFPTTYISSGYNGYDPYTSSGTVGSNGVFYDNVINRYCNYGTSYSDKAAMRAREMAEKIKSSGATIFSIGVDVGGQTIQQYINNGFTYDGVKTWESDGTPKWKSFSVIDCGDGTVTEPKHADPTYNIDFEIGDSTSTSAYVNWLRDSIGSGYYYDSTNAAGLQSAYDSIFEEILRMKKESSEADWVAQDPIPLAPPEYLEFIGFYDINGALIPDNADVLGLNGEGNENTAEFAYDDETNLNTIRWDLKRSGYDEVVSGDTTTYYYKLVYRVRLKNELDNFVEDQVYDTNAPTSLSYQVFESVDGVLRLSEHRKVNFKIPAVHGYLSELQFMKTDTYGSALGGAEFILSHDTASCTLCRGDGENRVDVPDLTAVSAADGTVLFTDIPSGHKYTLYETKAPPGYISDGKKYHVTVSYDILTVEDGWTGVVVNNTGVEFPSTGGFGIFTYICSGTFIVIAAVTCGCIRRHKRRKGSEM